MQAELLCDARAQLGESPFWSAAEQALYWIDIKAPALHRLDPIGGKAHSWPMPAEIGAFALRGARGGAVVALRHGLFALYLHSGRLAQVADAPYDPATHRFNDGRCDAAGRFWIGVMHEPAPGCPPAPPQERAQPVQVLEAGRLRASSITAELANGLAWSPDGRTLYCTDTQARQVRAFGFDVASGAVGPGSTFARFEEGRPDGASVDAAGNYWCALFGESELVRFDPMGVVRERIVLPVSQPTMCAFGGLDRRDLFITSAREGLSEEALRREPNAGGVFRLRAALQGQSDATYAG